MKIIDDDDIVQRFLNDRDSRVEYQRKLVNTYNKPIICLRVNYPGPNKNNLTTTKINEIIYKRLFGLFEEKIIFENSYISLEGPITILVVDDNHVELKKQCLQIEENHYLGRLVDIDVYDENYCAISRIDLGMNLRKCYICNEFSFICSKAKKHSEKDIVFFIENKVKSFID